MYSLFKIIFWGVIIAVGETGRGAEVRVGDQWVKAGDWELGDHVTEPVS